jgi:3'-phosphoadenosine 5'-phosphosulfate sulfotransferase (PAPS reductase)/FAD synthetase
MENRHQIHDLAQMQSLPLEAKIRMTKRRIRDWYEHFDGQVYISFSGGKDSTVLKHIIDSMYSDVPALFVNTGLEYPEIQKFAMAQKNVVTVRPEMRFDEVLKKHGYPIISKNIAHIIGVVQRQGKSCKTYSYLQGTAKGKNEQLSQFNCEKWEYLVDSGIPVSEKCCDIMKKKPLKKYEKETGRKAFIGTMAQESRNRTMAWLKHGCNAFESKKPTSQPLSFWTEQDILEYLVKFNVPYASVYGEIQENEKGLCTTGASRTGCIFCMFGCHLEKEPNRFQILKQTHPRQYEYCINGGEMVDGKWQPNREGLGLGKILDCIEVKY